MTDVSTAGRNGADHEDRYEPQGETDETRIDMVPRPLALMPETRLPVYEMLVEKDPLSADELIRDLDISSATIYRAVEDLEAAGIVHEELAVDFSSAKNQRTRYSVVDNLDHDVGDDS